MKVKADKETQSSATFSMSVATLVRIDNLLQGLIESWLNGNVLYIQRILFNLYKELHPFLDKNDKKIGDRKLFNIRESIGYDNNNQTFNIVSGLSAELNDFDFWIRDKLHEKGLLMAKADNPEFAISQM